MLSFDEANQKLISYMEEAEKNHFFEQVGEMDEEIMAEALEEENPHAYLLTLIVKHKGNEDAVINELIQEANRSML